MKHIQPVVIKRKLAKPPAKVWQALTNAKAMSKWFFELKEFKPEKGYTFRMMGHREGANYPFTGIVTEVEPGRMISFDWIFDDFQAITNVRIEIMPDGDGTLLQLTHIGLDSLPQNHPHFELNNIITGWEYFLERLTAALEKD